MKIVKLALIGLLVAGLTGCGKPPFNEDFLGVWAGDSVEDLNIGDKIEITKKNGVVAVVFTPNNHGSKNYRPDYKDGVLIFEQGGKLTLDNSSSLTATTISIKGRFKKQL